MLQVSNRHHVLTQHGQVLAVVGPVGGGLDAAHVDLALVPKAIDVGDARLPRHIHHAPLRLVVPTANVQYQTSVLRPACQTKTVS